ncbi:ATP-binding protein [Bacteroides caecigallinarum]|uniref:ATP-binding protein n=2 Tax=Bacteroidales TaxID=171549 RepID=A0A9D9HRI4_9BACT|nr:MULTISPECIES: ATP-binding protein [Bacteroidaceae]MBM6842516.1 ATP-binding protein [Phocaeicola plebeius]MBM6961803.1 ATP-binding protein [Bacteroides caecigallinarum]MBO8458902.1 ATP-binding protein [Candidatus Gallipaludibacter merdavium]
MAKEYNINVDPRILELLGPNLYTNIYYVLAELIANAYDADAKNVYIISNKDDIRIEDDGHGMSYDNGDIKKFLNVAGVSRTNENESFSRSGERRKMGRKGVGKLAALSVSESVDIMTICNGEKSGFVLARRPNDGNKLTPIEDENISFCYIQNSGTAIVMRNPQYRLHKSLDAIKRNLLKIFPLVDDNFKIHIIRGKEEEIVEKFDENVAKELCSLIILGEQHADLLNYVPDYFPKHRSDLVEKRDEYSVPLTIKDNNGNEHEYNLQIEGWIGAYKTTRGRKSEVTDFPDNFISLYANKKMGEFNILPIVGQNKLNEVYIVGQLYVDLFELSELPDMALSNRQGYKSDDIRYETVIKYVREILLPDILKKRVLYTDLTKAAKKTQKIEEQKDNEAKLRKMVDTFKDKASESVALAIERYNSTDSPYQSELKGIISNAINDNIPELGLKTVVDSQKKKILISHTYKDKDLADVVYNMLLFNNVPSEDVLYTSCDDEVCRIPEGVSIYNYLRDFFVESYSKQKLFVLFITSDNTPKAWGAMTEIGASWITQIDNKIFNIPPFKPQHPLNDEALWHSTNRNEENVLSMNPLNADIFCQKVEHICDELGYKKRIRKDNKDYLKTLVKVEN